MWLEANPLSYSVNMRHSTLLKVTTGSAALILLAVVVYYSFGEANADDALLRRCEVAIQTCETKIKNASSEDDWKSLSIDVDYIYEKLDSVMCTHPRDYKRKELRKALVLRCTALAKIIDLKTSS